MLKAWEKIKLSILFISITTNISFMPHPPASKYIW